MNSTTETLRGLLTDLNAGRMPPAEAIAEAQAMLDASDRARAEMRKALEPPTDSEWAQTLDALATGQVHMALTRPQWERLGEMLGGPVATYGKARAAVQNRLVRLGLAIAVDDGARCAITNAGRKVHEMNTRHGRFVADIPGRTR